ncbi:MAG: GLUG motif-containing protein, partial [Bacillota bacterium]
SYAGGIVGHAEDSASMSIEYCNNSGNITGTSNVGGIVGKTIGATINECYNTGKVAMIGKDGSYFGGIAGYSYGSTISNCYAKCNVSGTDYVGGLVGYTDADKITSCYFAGNDNSNGDNYDQYLFGYIYETGTIEDCYYVVNDLQSATIKVPPTESVKVSLSNVASVSVAYATDLTETVSCTAYETSYSSGSYSANSAEYTSSLVSLLNGEKGTAWAVDTEGINSGYPILTSMEYSIDADEEEVSGGSSNSRNITISSQYTVGGAEEEETPEPEVTVTPTVTPTVAPTAEPTVQPTATPVEIPDATEAEETSNGYIAWIIIGILALAAVGYVIYKKKH